MTRAFFTFLFFTLLSFPAAAQVLITGNVYASVGNPLPLPGIKVLLLDGDSVIRSTVTDTDGHFMTLLQHAPAQLKFYYASNEMRTPLHPMGADTILDSVRIEKRVFNGCISAQHEPAVQSMDQTIQRYPNGTVYMSGVTWNDKRQGEWFSFYSDGSLWSVGYYHNGVREGYAVSFFQNGRKSSEGNYVEGKMKGHWIFWNEDGTVAAEKEY